MTVRGHSLLLSAALAIGIVADIAVAAQAASPDVERGRSLFAGCAMCHPVAPGANGIGPTLAGVVGRKAGAAANYRYSAAMTGSGLTWTPARLDAFLAKPSGVIPGTRMAYPGVAQPRDREAIIAYLSSLR